MAEVTTALAGLTEQHMIRLSVTGRDVLVGLIAGQVVAYEDGCGHRGTSLAEGLIRDCIVTCPAHLWRYDLRTGHRHDSPGGSLPRFNVQIDGDLVRIDMPDLPPEKSLREILLDHAKEGHA
ncbi:MAG: Rieske 2Fe-2S domain-containing protein [Actinomycetes bacterium]